MLLTRDIQQAHRRQSDRNRVNSPERHMSNDQHAIPVTRLDTDLEKYAFLRFFWLVGSYNLLFILGFMIFTNTFLSITLSSIFLWTTCIVLIIGRLIDILFFKGTTDMGEPATLLHWIKYSFNIFFISALIWVIAFFGRRLMVHLFLGL